MGISYNQLRLEVEPVATPTPTIPMATESDFNPGLTFLPTLELFSAADSDSYVYYNVDTCPDCGSGMIRQGRCCVCPGCGFETCLA